MKPSFARAEGRNYRQLPARARLREKPSPADIFYSKRYSLSQFECKWRDAFFGTGVQAQRSLAAGVRVGNGMKWGGNRNLPPCFGILWVPGVRLALRSSRLLWKATASGLVVSWTPLAITGRSERRFDRWFFADRYRDCAGDRLPGPCLEGSTGICYRPQRVIGLPPSDTTLCFARLGVFDGG